MCSPSTPKVKNIVPLAPESPEAPPKAVEVEKDNAQRAKRKSNPLRIDLASGGGSGVNV